MDGEGGNDKMDGGDGNDNITGGSGNDNIYGSANYLGLANELCDDFNQQDCISVVDDDYISGNAGNDCIHGGSGHDQLNGNSGNDRIAGYGVIRGGAGNDKLTAWYSHLPCSENTEVMTVLEGEEGNDRLWNKGCTASLRARVITGNGAGGNDYLNSTGTSNVLIDNVMPHGADEDVCVLDQVAIDAGVCYWTSGLRPRVISREDCINYQRGVEEADDIALDACSTSSYFDGSCTPPQW